MQHLAVGKALIAISVLLRPPPSSTTLLQQPQPGRDLSKRVSAVLHGSVGAGTRQMVRWPPLHGGFIAAISFPTTTTTSTTANLKTDCRSCVLFAPASGAPKWQARFRQAHGLYFSRGRRNSSSLDLGCVKAAVEPHLQPPLNIRNRKPELQAWRGI